MFENQSAAMTERRRRSKVLALIEIRKLSIADFEKKLHDLPAEIAALESLLGSLDHTFSLHEVRVNPASVVGKSFSNRKGYEYGLATRLTARFLRLSAGEPISTRDLAEFLEREMGTPSRNMANNNFIARAKKILRTFAKSGEVEQLQTAIGTTSAFWRLKGPPSSVDL